MKPRHLGHHGPVVVDDLPITIGGAGLGGQAIALGLVDECQLFLKPIVVGGGKRALPGNIGRNSNSSTSAGSEAGSFSSGTGVSI